MPYSSSIEGIFVGNILQYDKVEAIGFEPIQTKPKSVVLPLHQVSVELWCKGK